MRGRSAGGRFFGVALAALGGAILASMGGCVGYSFQSTHDESVRTVSVDIFANRTSSPGLEIALTEAIIKEIQARTPWRVAEDAVADTRLTGAITRVGYRQLSRTRGIGLAQEVSFELTVDFDWKDSRTGELLAGRRSFDTLATFVPTRGVDERVEIGQQGAMQKIAERIVNEMRATW